ncbi:unnamed protein product [Calypogeia fissa]
MASSGGADDNRRQAGGRGKKRKRQSKYLQHSGKKSTISAGVQGFLITCVAGKERQSIKEAINLLDQFSEGAVDHGRPTRQDEPSRSSASAAGDSQENGDPSNTNSPGPPPDAEGSDDDSTEASGDSDGEGLGWTKCRRVEESSAPKQSHREANSETPNEPTSNVRGPLKICETGEASKSFDELLAAELEDLRDHRKARFVGYETGCNGIIFVRMHVDKGVQQKGPQELAEAIVREAAASKKSRSRFCMRLLPVELTCYASTSEVQKAAEPLILRHFPKDPDQASIKFAVICEARANTNLNKMEFIHAVAKMVPEPHVVDLKKPDKTILIQIVKTACAIGVVQDFKELSKYNLRQLTSPIENQTKVQPTIESETKLE